MRPSGETAIASRIMSPAPDKDRWPRWIMCQSPAAPSVAEYWHIGAMTIRFSRRRSPIIRGSNKRLMKFSLGSTMVVFLEGFDAPLTAAVPPQGFALEAVTDNGPAVG